MLVIVSTSGGSRSGRCTHLTIFVSELILDFQSNPESSIILTSLATYEIIERLFTLGTILNRFREYGQKSIAFVKRNWKCVESVRPQVRYRKPFCSMLSEADSATN